jgi:hypothetical protein
LGFVFGDVQAPNINRHTEDAHQGNGADRQTDQGVTAFP